MVAHFTIFSKSKKRLLYKFLIFIYIYILARNSLIKKRNSEFKERIGPIEEAVEKAKKRRA